MSPSELGGETPPEEPGPERPRMTKKRGHYKRKISASMFSFFAWVGFAIIWLFFFAAGYGIFENIAVIIAGFLILGAINAVMWIPSIPGARGGGWRARLSAVGAIAWVTFVVIWLPFYMESFTIYQNVSILMLSFIIMLGVVAAPWTTFAAFGNIGTGRRPSASLFATLLWSLFVVLWMWLYAELYTGYQNVAIVLTSVIFMVLLLGGLWIPWARRLGSRKGGTEIGVLLSWLVVLCIWFWFFADGFNLYQNLAVFLVSVLIFGGLGGGIAWKRMDSLDSFDFD
ncbi:MAG: hypothetical protein ACP6KW_12100 [Candidatus Thorarchaeota archaeon]